MEDSGTKRNAREISLSYNSDGRPKNPKFISYDFDGCPKNGPDL